ncbi:MAG: glutaredoxin family protein [Nitriliruptorales bacterium]|nr:glutaredoxin family protein [Nitriliruptorales bacterium]
MRFRARHRPRVTVYTRKGCHLCGEAEALVRRWARRNAEVDVVDIDTDPALIDRYTVRVPVVAVDDREIAEFQVDTATLRAAIREARRH